MTPIVLTPTELDAYAAHLHTQEKSPHTIEKYLRDSRAYLHFAAGRPLTKELAVAYKTHLIESGRYKKSSINSMLASVCAFLDFLGMPECKPSGVRIQKSPYQSEDRCLTKAEYLRLRASASGNPRLCLILETIAGTGIRISELRFITVEALQNRAIHVTCKSKTRTIILPSDLRKRLLTYAKKFGIRSGPIFCTRSGNPVNRSNIWAEMKRLCAKAGVAKSKVFPHNLRKLFARMYYELSKDIAQLADLLGHSSINTTRIYIMTTESEIRTRVERVARSLLPEKNKKTTLFA